MPPLTAERREAYRAAIAKGLDDGSLSVESARYRLRQAGIDPAAVSPKLASPGRLTKAARQVQAKQKPQKVYASPLEAADAAVTNVLSGFSEGFGLPIDKPDPRFPPLWQSRGKVQQPKGAVVGLETVRTPARLVGEGANIMLGEKGVGIPLRAVVKGGVRRTVRRATGKTVAKVAGKRGATAVAKGAGEFLPQAGVGAFFGATHGKDLKETAKDAALFGGIGFGIETALPLLKAAREFAGLRVTPQTGLKGAAKQGGKVLADTGDVMRGLRRNVPPGSGGQRLAVPVGEARQVGLETPSTQALRPASRAGVAVGPVRQVGLPEPGSPALRGAQPGALVGEAEIAQEVQRANNIGNWLMGRLGDVEKATRHVNRPDPNRTIQELRRALAEDLISAQVNPAFAPQYMQRISRVLDGFRNLGYEAVPEMRAARNIADPLATGLRNKRAWQAWQDELKAAAREGRSPDPALEFPRRPQEAAPAAAQAAPETPPEAAPPAQAVPEQAPAPETTAPTPEPAAQGPALSPEDQAWVREREDALVSFREELANIEKELANKRIKPGSERHTELTTQRNIAQNIIRRVEKELQKGPPKPPPSSAPAAVKPEPPPTERPGGAAQAVPDEPPPLTDADVPPVVEEPPAEVVAAIDPEGATSGYVRRIQQALDDAERQAQSMPVDEYGDWGRRHNIAKAQEAALQRLEQEFSADPSLRGEVGAAVGDAWMRETDRIASILDELEDTMPAAADQLAQAKDEAVGIIQRMANGYKSLFGRGGGGVDAFYMDGKKLGRRYNQPVFFDEFDLIEQDVLEDLGMTADELREAVIRGGNKGIRYGHRGGTMYNTGEGSVISNIELRDIIIERGRQMGLSKASVEKMLAIPKGKSGGMTAESKAAYKASQKAAQDARIQAQADRVGQLKQQRTSDWNKGIRKAHSGPGIDTEDLTYAYAVGKLYYLKGARAFGEWSEAVMREMGQAAETVRPHLKDIYARSVLEDSAAAWASNLNLDYIDSPKQLVDELLLLVNQAKDDIITKTRGVVTWEETLENARKLAEEMTPWKESRLIRSKKVGRAFNAEELTLLDTLEQQQAGLILDLKRALTMAKASGNAEQVAAIQKTLLKETDRGTAITAAARGGSAEAGRALQIHKRMRSELDLPYAFGPGAQGGLGVGGPLTAEQMRKGIRLAEQMGMSAENLAKLIEEMPDDPEAMLKFLHARTKYTTGEKLFTYAVTGWLSSPVTWFRNAFFNTMRVFENVAERPALGGVDAVLHALRPGYARSYYSGEALPLAEGTLRASGKAIREGLNTFVKGLSPEELSRLDLPAHWELPGGVYTNVPTRVLKAADVTARLMHLEGEAYALAYGDAVRKGLKGKALVDHMQETLANPPDWLVSKATLRSKRNILVDPNKATADIIRALGNPYVRWLVPFRQVPFALARMAKEYSAVGLLDLLVPEARQAGRATEVITRAGIGMMGSLLGYKLAIEGRLTGAAPRDQRKRDAFYRAGKEPFSVRIRDNNVSYRDMGAMGLMLAGGAAIADAMREDGDDPVWSQFLSSGLTAGKYLTDMIPIQGLLAFADLLNAEESQAKSERFFRGVPTTAVPYSGAMRFAAQTIDPVIRDSTAGFYDHMRNGLPFISSLQNPRLDNLGQVSIRKSKVWPHVALPIPTSSAQIGQVERELTENGITVGQTSRTMTVNGKSHKLTPQQYHELVSEFGRVVKQNLVATIESEAYQAADRETRQATLEWTIDYYRSLMRKHYAAKWFGGDQGEE